MIGCLAGNNPTRNEREASHHEKRSVGFWPEPAWQSRPTARPRPSAAPANVELFAEAPATKQVAQQLGEPPTKLYHHANALERAGLLRLSKTRQNRGAIEKWYEAASDTISGRQLSRSRPMQQAISGLVTVALEDSARGRACAAETAWRSPARDAHDGGWERAPDRRYPQAITSGPEGIAQSKSGEKRLGERDAQRWTLTIAFVPAARARG